MAGSKWTTDQEYTFLMAYLPQWLETRNSGKKAQKNRNARALLNTVMEQFEKDFKTSLPAMNLPRLRLGGTVVQRQAAFQNRLRNWFNNRLKETSGVAGRRRILDLRKKKAPRVAQAEHAYSKLHWATKLKAPIEAEWEAHQKEPNGTICETSQVAFRNRRVRELLMAETEEVKAEVEAKRHAINSAGDSGVFWSDVGEAEDAEIARRNRLCEKQSNIAVLMRTIKEVHEALHEQTGCVILTAWAVNPPIKGNVVPYAISYGATVGDELDFADYSGTQKWATFGENFLEWAQECFDPATIAAETLSPELAEEAFGDSDLSPDNVDGDEDDKGSDEEDEEDSVLPGDDMPFAADATTITNAPARVTKASVKAGKEKVVRKKAVKEKVSKEKVAKEKVAKEKVVKAKADGKRPGPKKKPATEPVPVKESPRYPAETTLNGEILHYFAPHPTTTTMMESIRENSIARNQAIQLALGLPTVRESFIPSSSTKVRAAPTDNDAYLGKTQNSTSVPTRKSPRTSASSEEISTISLNALIPMEPGAMAKYDTHPNNSSSPSNDAVPLSSATMDSTAPSPSPEDFQMELDPVPAALCVETGPSLAENDSAAAASTGNAALAASLTEHDTAPAGSPEDAALAGSNEDISPAGSPEDSAPAGATEDVAPAFSDKDVAPAAAAEDISPAASSGDAAQPAHFSTEKESGSDASAANTDISLSPTDKEPAPAPLPTADKELDVRPEVLGASIVLNTRRSSKRKLTEEKSAPAPAPAICSPSQSKKQKVAKPKENVFASTPTAARVSSRATKGKTPKAWK